MVSCWEAYSLQFDGDALRVSAYGRHAPAEGFPDGAVPLQGALAAALQPPQASTHRRHIDGRGEHGLHHPSEEDKETSWWVNVTLVTHCGTKVCRHR